MYNHWDCWGQKSLWGQNIISGLLVGAEAKMWFEVRLRSGFAFAVCTEIKLIHRPSKSSCADLWACFSERETWLTLLPLLYFPTFTLIHNIIIIATTCTSYMLCKSTSFIALMCCTGPRSLILPPSSWAKQLFFVLFLYARPPWATGLYCNTAFSHWG